MNIRDIASELLRELEKDIHDEKKCSDEELETLLTHINPAGNGYVSQHDLLNVDECCRLLGLGYNRAKFYTYVRKYKLKEVVLNNQKVGYRRIDIESLARKIRKDTA